jgi:uncharacterized protein YjbI with pentapeptide repeats
MKNLMTFLICALVSSSVFATDKGFRFNAEKGKCLNFAGQEGFNAGPEFIECADLRGYRLSSISFLGARILGLNMSQDPSPDCRYACESIYQEDMEFSGADARGMNATNAHFIRSTFDGANLSGAKFANATFTATGKKKNSFANTNFRAANLRNVTFEFASLEGADFREADMTGMIIKGSSFKGAHFNKFTLLPFSKAAALQLGMVYHDELAPLPVDRSDTYAPPEVPSNQDDRIFDRDEECGKGSGTNFDAGVKDCAAKLPAGLTARTPLTPLGEGDWRLARKDSQGTFWWNALQGAGVWRPAKALAMTPLEAQKYCAGLAMSLPAIEQFDHLIPLGLTSLFSEVAESQYWSSTSYGGDGLFYYFFDGTNGTTSFYQSKNSRANVLCSVIALP